MAKTPKAAPAQPATASVMLSWRVTPDDRDLVHQLVALRAAELADEDVEVSVASLLRWLVHREARARGLKPGSPVTKKKLGLK